MSLSVTKSKVIENQETRASLNLGEQMPPNVSHLTSNHQLKLSKDQNRLSHLLSVMPAGVLVVDHKGKVSLANNQAKLLLEEPLIGKLWREVIQRAFAPKADDGHEVSMRNGKRVKIDISPLTEEKGQLVVITDLTETRALQNRVSHMQRLSSLGKMVASLAHQVRTPLSAALLYAENLKSICDNDALAERFSDKLLSRLHDLESQVNDMLLFAKSGDNQIAKPMTSKDVETSACAQVEAQFVAANVSFKQQNLSESSRILANASALNGALGNLLHNALHAVSEVDDPQVCLCIQQATVNALPHIEFKVTDNGKGLGNCEAQKLFEPFFTTKSQGTGLGLAVVNTVAKAHRGFVNCGNNESGGAWFSIYIPMHDANKTEQTLGEAEREQN